MILLLLIIIIITIITIIIVIMIIGPGAFGGCALIPVDTLLAANPLYFFQLNDTTYIQMSLYMLLMDWWLRDARARVRRSCSWVGSGTPRTRTPSCSACSRARATAG